MKFEVGDLVVKRSGGIAMLVTDNVNLTCQWIEKGNYQTSEFCEHELVSLSDWIVAMLERERGKR